MNPIVTLAAGIVLGALGIRCGQKVGSGKAISDKTAAGTALLRGGLQRAGNDLRGAAVSGLSLVEKQSGQLRQRLEGSAGEPVVEAAAEAPKPATRPKRSPRKSSTAAADKANP
ncbi:hypothetical protein HOY34_07265 [Xinfangfangia sp. D13-10-4-6]|uniref:hypothetical protein n=1 Tax=Pseudogemmobacter hezensis TaxID=2737662 RepID=UPI0015536D39|nr:hypothetical protein [Pseudogemmobacter hezensis]NPD15002.1 hypothetical protein [Pseudogemmobacter hezensis]